MGELAGSRDGTLHVLVVEDDRLIRGMVADLLESDGYRVRQAADGFEAVNLLREAHPDLIVLDLMLPGMSGWQFLEQSREHLRRVNTPVVILSAIDGRGDYPMTLGVAAWFTKPLEVERFLTAVHDLAGPPGTAPRAAGSTRVLVVEDEPMIREVLVEHLSGEGFVVAAAASVDGALERLAKHADGEAETALIVLDLMLPGRNGWDFLKTRAADPHLAQIPVLVLSAAPQDRLREAQEMGADAYLRKPFDLDVLTAMIQSFLGPRSSRAT